MASGKYVSAAGLVLATFLALSGTVVAAGIPPPALVTPLPTVGSVAVSPVATAVKSAATLAPSALGQLGVAPQPPALSDPLQSILHALQPPAVARVVAGARAVVGAILPHTGDPGLGFLVVGSLVLVGGGLGVRRFTR